jgi:hypothetical protein
MSVIHVAALDVEAAQAEVFGRWYEQAHVPAMLARPGWDRMRRYECIDGQPRFVSIYDLDVRAFVPEHISEAPYRSGRFETRGIRNYHARTWREIHAAGNHLDLPEWINIVTVDVEAAHAAKFDRWYSEIHVPEILRCPAWRANRRYECIDGEPRFLAIYDLDDPDLPFATPEWESAVGWDEHVDHIRGYHGFRVYRLIHACAA